MFTKNEKEKKKRRIHCFFPLDLLSFDCSVSAPVYLILEALLIYFPFFFFLDLEAMMNSFISLILFCTFDDKLTRKFCAKLTEMGASESNALLRIKM